MDTLEFSPRISDSKTCSFCIATGKYNLKKYNTATILLSVFNVAYNETNAAIVYEVITMSV